MKLIRHRFPELYRFAALLALWAMLVPVGIGVFHTPKAMADHDMSAMHDCGNMGKLDSHDSKQPSHQLPSCPICKSLSLLGSGYTPPYVALEGFLPAPLPLYSVAQYDFVVKFTVPPQSRPRAPPVLI